INGIRARQIFELAKAGKIDEAHAIQHVTNDLIDAVLDNGLYPTIKCIMEEQGVHSGYCRKPMASATEETRAKAVEIYNTYIK
ncbi:dihydrodipicolinate synthase family protein, partial [Eubacterium aggregans]|uniref:dihydrodipicolinate synthase family protein n=1 Tax=Eubacterium aggregans TaxID=81409 RepID=UPI003F2FC727